MPGLDSIGIVAISHGRTGVVARACGLVDLKPSRAWSVPEVLRPLYESSTVLAHKTTMMDSYASTKICQEKQVYPCEKKVWVEEVMEADAVLWDVPRDGHQTLSANVSDGYMVWLDSLLKYV
ncbi:hypothetical protein LguiB_030043 [Lonicera macranthoides]